MLHLPKPAQYLLRFDDLCPTGAAQRWCACADLIAEFGLKPILAIVPENRDPELEQSAPDPDFWAPKFWVSMRAMQAAGATIALHGYRHICASAGRSLIPLSPQSEFAGVDLATQRAWIRDGLRILRGHGLDPRVWAAPRHGFDRNTLNVLKAEGIAVVSDGFARVPFVCDGFTWIPQQLWGPCEKSAGIWTICVHPNTASGEQIEGLREFLRDRAMQFTSVDRVLKEVTPQRLGLRERLYANLALRRVKARKWKRSKISGR